MASYHYDSQNRLLSLSNATAQITFTYDGKNRCSSRTINGTTTYYLYDGWNLIEERNAAGTEVTSYLHGNTIDEILAKIQSTNTIYYHHDALGNVTHLSDNTGQLLEKYRYDVYGNVTILNPTNGILPISSYGNRFLFTGREYIQEAGAYDLRNRFYDPVLGRFLSTDPIGFGLDEESEEEISLEEFKPEVDSEIEDINLYRYVHNNSINLTDPTGLVATVQTLRGNVKKKKCPDHNGQPPGPDEIMVITGPRSKALVIFSNGRVVPIGSNTLFSNCRGNKKPRGAGGSTGDLG